MLAFRVGDVEAGPGEIKFGSLGSIYLPDSTEVRIPVIVVRGKEDGPILWVSSTMHGTELTGAEVIRRIAREIIEPGTLRGTLVAVPVVNPLAFHYHMMNTPQDMYNLNRVFPGSNSSLTSFRLAHIIFSSAKLCDYVVDFHSNPSPAICFSITKESRNRETSQKSLELAAAFGITNIRMELKYERHRTGTLTDTIQQIGKPALTVELLYWRRIDETAVKVGVRGILNVMKYLKMIDGVFERQSDIKVFKGNLSRLELTASKGGIVHPEFSAGDNVRKGQTVAKIVNLYGDLVEEIKSPVDGFILAYPLLGNQAVATGDIVAFIGFERQERT